MYASKITQITSNTNYFFSKRIGKNSVLNKKRKNYILKAEIVKIYDNDSVNCTENRNSC